MNQARFQKQQREKARREKAAAKSARREERKNTSTDEEPTVEADQDVVLAELADLHARFDKGEVEFDDFVAAKEELTERLNVR